MELFDVYDKDRNLLYKGKELGRNQVIYEKSDLDSCSK